MEQSNVGFYCRQCGTRWETKEQAEACSTTPVIPFGTKYVTTRQAQVKHVLLRVKGIRGTGCCQTLVLSMPTTFVEEMRGLTKFRHGSWKQNCEEYSVSRTTKTHPDDIIPVTESMLLARASHINSAIARLENVIKTLRRIQAFYKTVFENGEYAAPSEDKKLANSYSKELDKLGWKRKQQPDAATQVSGETGPNA
jgi:hypothetical protein